MAYQFLGRENLWLALRLDAHRDESGHNLHRRRAFQIAELEDMHEWPVLRIDSLLHVIFNWLPMRMEPIENPSLKVLRLMLTAPPWSAPCTTQSSLCVLPACIKATE